MKTLPSSAYAGSPRGPQAAVASSPCAECGAAVPGVHQEEGPCAVGVLGAASGDTPLPEEGRLLVAGNAGDGHGEPEVLRAGFPAHRT